MDFFGMGFAHLLVHNRLPPRDRYLQGVNGTVLPTGDPAFSLATLYQAPVAGC